MWILNLPLLSIAWQKKRKGDGELKVHHCFQSTPKHGINSRKGLVMDAMFWHNSNLELEVQPTPFRKGTMMMSLKNSLSSCVSKIK